MNQFRTITLSLLFGLSFFASSYSQNSSPKEPIYTLGSFVYADIDTASQKLYILLPDGLWLYEMTTKSWAFLMDSNTLPSPITDFNFAFDSNSNRILLWSRGVGLVYQIDLYQLSITRIDHSFEHKNQYGNFPFIRNGNIYAFGGYGFWQLKNYITFFNPNLTEWNIVSVSPESTFPPPMVPENGFFNSKTDELYIYGGQQIENNRQDDHSAIKFTSNDIFKFSFSNSSWTEIGSILGNGVSPYQSSLDTRFGATNSSSTSMFSPSTEIWYLPVKIDNKANEIYYLTPYNTNTDIEYDPIEIPLGTSKPFLITNYLFNPKTHSAVFVGIDNQTNVSSLPLQIKNIPESILLKDMSLDNTTTASQTSIYLIVTGVFLVLGFLLIRLRNSGLTANKKHFTKNDILNLNSLNDSEKKLIQTLYEQQVAVDTQKLEELVWGDIHNYDYRRKLRNETINSINQKLSKLTGLTSEFIQRHKDPNDNRRYLYEIEKSNY